MTNIMIVLSLLHQLKYNLKMYDEMFQEVEKIYSISLNNSEKKNLLNKIKKNLKIFVKSQSFPIDLGIMIMFFINEISFLKPILNFLPYIAQANRLKNTLFFLTIFSDEIFLEKISEETIEKRISRYLRRKDNKQ